MGGGSSRPNRVVPVGKNAPQTIGTGNSEGSSGAARERAGEILETVQGYVESASSLKEHVEGIGEAADSLTALLQSGTHQYMALSVLGEFSDVASQICTRIAPALAFVAPALIFVSIVLKQVSAAVSLPASAATLARRCAALRPILKAAASSESMARNYSGVMQAMCSVLDDAAKTSESRWRSRIRGKLHSRAALQWKKQPRARGSCYSWMQGADTFTCGRLRPGESSYMSPAELIKRP